VVVNRFYPSTSRSSTTLHFRAGVPSPGFGVASTAAATRARALFEVKQNGNASRLYIPASRMVEKNASRLNPELRKYSRLEHLTFELVRSYHSV
jgi:hypothetical protein